MSYFEKLIPAFLSGDRKVPVDAGKGHRLPVTDDRQIELLKEIRDLLKVQTFYLSEFYGSEVKPEDL
jgi:hypothetical protein